MAIDVVDARIRIALAKLFAAFPGGASQDRSMRMNVYLEALSRVAPSFVEEAVTYAIRGKLFTSGNFPPTCAALSQCAEEFQDRSLREVPRPRHLEVESQNTYEQRQRIIKGFAQLIADLRHGRPIDPDKATAKVFYVED